MVVLFGMLAFFGMIAAVVFAAVWVIQKIRHRETKAKRYCIVAAAVMVVSFVIACIVSDPAEQTEEPDAPSAVTEESAEPTETPAETPAEDAAEPQETPEESPANPTSAPETEKPVQTPAEAPTETPEETEEPEIDPVEQDKADIEAAARDIVAQHYTSTDVSSVTVNENYGTDEDGDYVLLVYLTWNVKNSVDMTNKMLAMYSEDFAARVGTDIPKVNDFAVFWTVPYYSETRTAVKYSYLRNGDGMYEDSHMILVK
jgi:hypothetical protein